MIVSKRVTTTMMLLVLMMIKGIVMMIHVEGSICTCDGGWRRVIEVMVMVMVRTGSTRL